MTNSILVPGSINRVEKCNFLENFFSLKKIIWQAKIEIIFGWSNWQISWTGDRTQNFTVVSE